MEIKKVSQNGGMDGMYWDWKLTCNKCGLTKYYAADGFYGRPYKTFEEVVDDWNKKKEETIKTLEQESCEDAVSRQAVLGLFAQNADAIRPYSKTWEEVKALPPVNPHQKTGHWIIMGDGYIKCSKCGRITRTESPDTYYFCMCCGANMSEIPTGSESEVNK